MRQWGEVDDDQRCPSGDELEVVVVVDDDPGDGCSGDAR